MPVDGGVSSVCRLPRKRAHCVYTDNSRQSGQTGFEGRLTSGENHGGIEWQVVELVSHYWQHTAIMPGNAINVGWMGP